MGLTITSKIANCFQNKSWTENKQKNFIKLSQSIFNLEENIENNNANNASIKNQLEQLFNLNDSLSSENAAHSSSKHSTNNKHDDNSLTELRKNRPHNQISNFFGATKTFTRSTINAAVILFIKENIKSLDNCFDDQGNLKIEKFNEFLKKHLGENNNINPHITPRYLGEIKLNRKLCLITFGNYWLSTEKINDNQTSSKFFEKPNSDGYVTNQRTRKIIPEDEIILAKKSALDYFKLNIMNKLNNISNQNIKNQVILKLIFLQKIINLAMRHLINYNIGYETLEILFTKSKIFEALDINEEKDKLHFINNLIIINHHRNNGMFAKRVLKTPAMVTWLLLPIFSTSSMVMNSFVSLKEFGVAAGGVALAGAGIEGGGDIMNYSERTEWLNRQLNCGDRLKSHTDSYEKLEEMIFSDNKQLLEGLDKLIPTDQEIIKLCKEVSKDSPTSNTLILNQTITIILQQLNGVQENTDINKWQKLTKAEIDARLLLFSMGVYRT